MLPIIEREVVNDKKWVSYEELLDYYAVSQSTPGIIMVNVATFVGYKVGGILGGFVATIGEVSPAIIIIMIIAKILKEFKESEYVKSAFLGLRPTVFGLILSAFISIFTSSVIFINNYKQTGNIKDVFDIRTIIIFVLVFLLNKKWKIHPIYYVILSALIGILLGL